jgi:hypothetical protein
MKKLSYKVSLSIVPGWSQIKDNHKLGSTLYLYHYSEGKTRQKSSNEKDLYYTIQENTFILICLQPNVGYIIPLWDESTQFETFLI